MIKLKKLFNVLLIKIKKNNEIPSYITKIDACKEYLIELNKNKKFREKSDQIIGLIFTELKESSLKNKLETIKLIVKESSMNFSLVNKILNFIDENAY